MRLRPPTMVVVLLGVTTTDTGRVRLGRRRCFGLFILFWYACVLLVELMFCSLRCSSDASSCFLCMARKQEQQVSPGQLPGSGTLVTLLPSGTALSLCLPCVALQGTCRICMKHMCA